MEYVTPFDERVREPVAHAPRPEDLCGRTVALLDINKARGAEFLDRVEELLREHGADTVRAAKPSFSRPATSLCVHSSSCSGSTVMTTSA